MTNLQKITKHINDTLFENGVPPLEFGVKIKDEYGTHIYLGLVDPEDKPISIIQNYDSRSEWVGCVDDDDGISDYEILPKDPSIEDVIYSAGKLGIKLSVNSDMELMHYEKYMTEFEIKEGWSKIFADDTCEWTPNKTLSQQSPEVWDLLEEVFNLK